MGILMATLLQMVVSFIWFFVQVCKTCRGKTLGEVVLRLFSVLWSVSFVFMGVNFLRGEFWADNFGQYVTIAWSVLALSAVERIYRAFQDSDDTQVTND